MSNENYNPKSTFAQQRGKFDPTKVKPEFLSTAAKDLSRALEKKVSKWIFGQIIKFEQDIKPN